MAAAGKPGRSSPQRSENQTGTTAGVGSGPRPEESTLGRVAGTVQHTAQDLAASTLSGAGAAWDRTVHGAQGAGSLVAGTAGDAWGEMTHLMRRYPLATFAAGAALGFLLARLLDPATAPRGNASLYYSPDGPGRDVYPYAK